MQYFHGGDIYRNQVSYDFSVNINPLGMPQESIAAAEEAIRQAGVYPDWQGEALRRAIAGSEGVKEEQVILGNGAAELIYILCQALRPEKGLAAAPSFQEYEAAVLGTGGRMRFFYLRKEKGFGLTEEIMEDITEDTDLLFLCNPNNPAGGLTDRELLQKIAKRCEVTGTFFCLDECFLPFSEKEGQVTMKHLLEQYPRLMILRAFTKVYGMPGLRLGYGLCADQAFLEKMRGCLQPWNTSLPAQMAGIAALKDARYLERTRKIVREQRKYLIEELGGGIADEIYDSQVNFLLFHSREDLKKRLLEQKVLIRSCENFRNLGKGYFRIGVRLPEENRELVRRMRSCMTIS